MRLDAIQFACLNERREHGPVLGTCVVTGKEGLKLRSIQPQNTVLDCPLSSLLCSDCWAAGQFERILFKPLVSHDQSGSIPPDHLQPVGAFGTKHVNGPIEWLLL